MKELTLKDKESLIALLERHYTIKEKNFIKAIASNDEERLDLTLTAYAVGAEQINTPTNVPTTLVPTNTSVVVINTLYSKLRFVKAIQEAKGIRLQEAKNHADHMLIEYEGTLVGQFYSKPFHVGNFSDSIFTSDQWKKICDDLGNNMEWQYV